MIGLIDSIYRVLAPDWLWAQCDNCLQWRRLPAGFKQDDLPEKWFCHMNPDAAFKYVKTVAVNALRGSITGYVSINYDSIIKLLMLL